MEEKPINNIEETREVNLEATQQLNRVISAQKSIDNRNQSNVQEDKKPKRKEIQDKIIQLPINNNGRVTEEEFLNMLKMVSPGTNLRTALEGILKAECGALLVIENDQTLELMDGGFRVNCRFTPQKLVELCKMDGAIILSKDTKKINDANVLLTPDSKIKSLETGTRHKAAERTSKQAGTPVIAVSERKGEVTLFYKNIKYHLKSSDVILRRANEHLHHLEKQREAFDLEADKLNRLELKNHQSLQKALHVIQKGRIIQKISQDLKRNIIELGNEATLIKTRLKELTKDVDKEINLIIKDYTKLDLKKSKTLLESLSYDEILDEGNILRTLAYEKPVQTSAIKGWRILSKTSLEEPDIALLIRELGSLGKAIHSNINVCKSILGEERAQTFKEEIDRIKLSY
jgi:diadenylate cyclase